MKGCLYLLQFRFLVQGRIMSYYAVAKGRSPGVYRSWDECKAQIDKFSGAAFKKFSSLAAAQGFIDERGSSSLPCLKSSRDNAKPYSGGFSKSKDYFSTKARTYNHYAKKRAKSRDSDDSDSCAAPLTTYSSTTISKEGFKKDCEGRVDIYTDGACSSNGHKYAKAGIGVYFGDGHPANVSKPVRGRPTNNNAEIQAVTEAARVARANGLSKIRINTDSQFLINCKTKWMKRWKARGWKTATNQPVINKEELEEMERALAPLDVEFNHVRGHVGVHGNEMADKLARAGAVEYNG